MANSERDDVERIDTDTVNEFLDVIDRSAARWDWDSASRRYSWIFRGQADSEWRLLPSAWRDGNPVIEGARRSLDGLYADMSAFDLSAPNVGGSLVHGGTMPDVDVIRRVTQQIHAEVLLISDFLQRADDLGLAPIGQPSDPNLGRNPFNNPAIADQSLASLRMVVAIAQHHGLPTQLLDWSDDPYIAAYFAAQQPSGSERISVWALKETAVPPGQPLDPAAWERLLAMSEAEREALLAASDRIYLLPGQLSVIRPSRTTNLHLRMQRGAFASVENAWTYALDNEGAFPSLDQFCTADHSVEQRLKCVTLPSSERDELLNRLDQHGVSEMTLMPSLDAVARTTASRWSY